jgi:hypothetical protein
MSKPKAIKTLDDLTPDSANANKGSERGSGLIEKSLEQFGAGRSILVDKHGRVIAGNKTLEGWAGLGTERIRVVQTTGHELVVVQRTDLDLEKGGKARQLAIVDNRAGQLSLTWDADVLLSQCQTMEIEPESIGFTADELESLGARSIEPVEESEREGKAITCPHCGAQFKPGAKE